MKHLTTPSTVAFQLSAECVTLTKVDFSVRVEQLNIHDSDMTPSLRTEISHTDLLADYCVVT
jgi:hypothetical protein